MKEAPARSDELRRMQLVEPETKTFNIKLKLRAKTFLNVKPQYFTVFYGVFINTRFNLCSGNSRLFLLNISTVCSIMKFPFFCCLHSRPSSTE